MKLITASSVFALAIAALTRAQDSWYMGGDHNVTCVRNPYGHLDCEKGFTEGAMEIDLAELGLDNFDEAAQTDAPLEKRDWECQLGGLGCSAKCYAANYCSSNCDKKDKCHCSCKNIPVWWTSQRCVKSACSK
ncbi:hypothetical protein D0869_08693 [Hortaea werneckii]|uniref:Invertebrate defensins family profile domain-containing protein n=1 Tax=Hortaea werneckii TaxID=91943 RepID=A0A3M6ZNE2_HORWE|nr:hypothetical protein D0869_08693 [Hortaea werneckii]RMY16778.1 hypothetical protein D0868_00130 [Hortaea werneckii]